jgi:hypothetical protein
MDFKKFFARDDSINNFVGSSAVNKDTSIGKDIKVEKADGPLSDKTINTLKEEIKSEDVKKEKISPKKMPTSDNNYTCYICDKMFSNKNYLNYHIRAHLGENPYSCDICKKSFSHPSNLFKHNRSPMHKHRQIRYNKHSPLKTNLSCNESIKVEDIKKEIKEEKIVDTIKQEIKIEDIKKEEKDEKMGVFPENTIKQELKTEGIKEEIQEEQIDALPPNTIKQEIKTEDIKEEIKEEEGINDNVSFNDVTENTL